VLLHPFPTLTEDVSMLQRTCCCPQISIMIIINITTTATTTTTTATTRQIKRSIKTT